MSYPAAALQKAIYDAVMADSALATAMGGTVRAYDRVPSPPTFPYITIPDGQFIDDGDTCEADRFEGYVDLQVWSRAVGQVEAKSIAAALRGCILSGLTITGWTANVIQHQQTIHSMEGDGLTARARLTFRFILEPA